MKRNLILSPAFKEFEQNANPRTREKLCYAISILETVELRVSVDNEIRVILFTVDNDNINLATNVILLNGFVKKSTKDYDKEITKAINILRSVL